MEIGLINIVIFRAYEKFVGLVFRELHGVHPRVFRVVVLHRLVE